LGMIRAAKCTLSKNAESQSGEHGPKKRGRCVLPIRRLLHRSTNQGIRQKQFVLPQSLLIFAQLILLAIAPCTLVAQERDISILEFPMEPSLRDSFPLPVRGMDQPVGGYSTGESYCNSLGAACGSGSAIVLLDVQGLSTIVYARSLRFPEYPDVLIVNTLNFFEAFEIRSRDRLLKLRFSREYGGRAVEKLGCNDQGVLWKIRATAEKPLFEVLIDSRVSCYGGGTLRIDNLDSIANPIGTLVTTTISIARAK
jgi:hypothetical protein